MFHTKQCINRKIKEYIADNDRTDEKIKIINKYKKTIFKIIDSEDMKTAKNIQNKLMSKNDDIPEIINKIL